MNENIYTNDVVSLQSAVISWILIGFIIIGLIFLIFLALYEISKKEEFLSSLNDEQMALILRYENYYKFRLFRKKNKEVKKNEDK